MKLMVPVFVLLLLWKAKAKGLTSKAQAVAKEQAVAKAHPTSELESDEEEVWLIILTALGLVVVSALGRNTAGSRLRPVAMIVIEACS